MQQDEIFKLLLIILLLCNEKNRDCGDTGGCGNLNEIIIICLLMGMGRGECCCAPRDDSLLSPPAPATTF